MGLDFVISLAMTHSICKVNSSNICLRCSTSYRNFKILELIYFSLLIGPSQYCKRILAFHLAEFILLLLLAVFGIITWLDGFSFLISSLFVIVSDSSLRKSSKENEKRDKMK